METISLVFRDTAEFVNYTNNSIGDNKSLGLAKNFITSLQSSIESDGPFPTVDKITVNDECTTLVWEDDRLYFSFKILEYQVLWVFVDYDSELYENGIIDNTESEMFRILNTILISPTL